MKRSTLSAVAVAAAAALTLAACGGGSNDNGDNGVADGDSGGGSAENVTLTVTWWGNDDRAERTRKAEKQTLQVLSSAERDQLRELLAKIVF